MSDSDSFATPWTVASQAPLSMGFSKQEYWSGFPFPSLGDLPNPVTEPRSPALLETSLVAQTVKRLSKMRETWVRSLGREESLEKEMATHSSMVAWRIPWTEETG